MHSSTLSSFMRLSWNPKICLLYRLEGTNDQTWDKLPSPIFKHIEYTTTSIFQKIVPTPGGKPVRPNSQYYRKYSLEALLSLLRQHQWSEVWKTPNHIKMLILSFKDISFELINFYRCYRHPFIRKFKKIKCFLLKLSIMICKFCQ